MTDATGWTEEALTLACEGDTLQAVLARPDAGGASARIGVLVVVGGPQYRVGAHRQFVLLARRLAQAGYPVLRFDVRGMGDSTGHPRGFEEQQPDIAAALDALQRACGVDRVVLWGLCDGASASLLYLHAAPDQRIAGLALLNPWVRSEQGLAQTHVKHYYRERLLQPAFWGKLLRGGIGLGALRELGRNIGRARGGPGAGPANSFQQRMAAAWARFDGHLLVLLSGNDWTAREFDEQLQQGSDWKDALHRPRLQLHRLETADHTLSDAAARREAEEATLRWLHTLPRG